MHPEKLAECIDNAFGGLHAPAFEEMAAANYYVEEEFLSAVESKTWQELRPLHQYLENGNDIGYLSAKAYQYYIPAYLFALIDEAGDGLYLIRVLDSLWYEQWMVCRAPVRPLYSVPQRGWEELMPELEKVMPHLTYQERKAWAERRVSIGEKMAKVTAMTGFDWRVGDLRERWEERMALLTDQQKSCIAESLMHILGRTTFPPHVEGIQTMLDQYWSAFLVKHGEQ